MRSMVEGPKRLTLSDDTRQHSFHIRKHLARRNPHRLEAQLEQPPIALFVAFRPVAAIVRFAVHFDTKPCLHAGKVENEPFLRTLLAKPEPAGPPAKLLPEQHFRKAHLLAQLSRKLHRLSGRPHGPMFHPSQILPGTGRGTMRSMVEGPSLGHRPVDPSVSAPRCHLPVPGRILCAFAIVTS